MVLFIALRSTCFFLSVNFLNRGFRFLYAPHMNRIVRALAIFFIIGFPFYIQQCQSTEYAVGFPFHVVTHDSSFSYLSLGFNLIFGVILYFTLSKWFRSQHYLHNQKIYVASNRVCFSILLYQFILMLFFVSAHLVQWKGDWIDSFADIVLTPIYWILLYCGLPSVTLYLYSHNNNWDYIQMARLAFPVSLCVLYFGTYGMGVLIRKILRKLKSQD